MQNDTANLRHFISVLIPCYNEEKYISRCLKSVLNQDYAQDLMEVFVIDGMSNDHTRDIAREFTQKHNFIRLIDNTSRTVSHALNHGIELSGGDVIIRIDAHSEFPENYFSTLVKYLFELDADNVGGVWKTLPGSDSLISKAIAASSSHKFGVGNSLHKIGVKEIMQTDTVPYGCFKRELFKRIGWFDEDLIRNQDDEYNGRIIKNGGKIYIIPELVINYFARNTLFKMAEMFYQYGLFKPLVNKKLGAPATIRQFFPPLFVSGLLTGALICLLIPGLTMLYYTILLTYLSVSFRYSIQTAVQNRQPGFVLLMPLTFLVIHISYGYGYLAGLLKFWVLDFNQAKVTYTR